MDYYLKKVILLFILIAGLGFYLANGAVPHTLTIEKYGFLSGFYHGALAVFSFILRIFKDNTGVMAKNHTTGYLFSFWISCFYTNLFLIFRVIRNVANFIL